MKHPARSDFHTVVTAAGVSVTFKPTNSTYSFFRLAKTGALTASITSSNQIELPSTGKE
jgi:putative component of membrane protein insertase Oxa1/YidC/SpoIIIJ protein YidD